MLGLFVVLSVQPFDDGSHESRRMMTAADKTQALSLFATVVGYIMCLKSPDLGSGTNAAFAIAMAVIGVVPVFVGLYYERGEGGHKDDRSSEEIEFDDNPIGRESEHDAV
eukprot:COSAG06_NODE_17408_length_943_cov_0.986967_1_plen_110_part_00